MGPRHRKMSCAPSPAHCENGYLHRHCPGRPNGVSGGCDGTLKLWDLANGNERRTFSRHSESVSSLAMAPDGRTAISGSYDKTLKLWDLATGKELAPSPDTPILAVASPLPRMGGPRCRRLRTGR